jgi:steroid delta-isomerase-like uncharacterized protein
MDNETILRKFIQKVWNEKDFDSIPQFVAAEYTVHRDPSDPWEGKTLDHSEFKTRLKYSFDSFPDLHFDIRTAISDGDFVAIVWVMTGTNSGKIGDYPPTNKKIQADGITIYHFNNGKVCGHTQVYDRTTIMKQLGFLG